MTTDLDDEQLAIRCSIIRGGSSKGVFLRIEDLPPPGALRDRLLKRIMGSPDPLQLDGLGGARLLTSKIALIGPPSVEGADLDYTFAQVELDRDVIDYEGNCGNISAGVGPFSIDAGLIANVTEPVTEVRIHNTNTGKIIRAQVPVRGKRARVGGDFSIAGVPGTGARIEMDFSNTAGAKTGALLPTGHAAEELLLADGTRIEITVCDLANTIVFVHASSVGLDGIELPSTIDSNPEVCHLLREIRGRVATRLGFATSWEAADIQSPLLPMVVVLSKPRDHIVLGSRTCRAADVDITARFFFMNRTHEAMSGTGACCLAAASRVPGSVVFQQLDSQSLAHSEIRIGHPSGAMEVTVETDPLVDAGQVRFRNITFARTARRLMDGVLYVPRSDTLE